MKNIGKPCTGKPYARFDEGGLVMVSMDRLVRHRQTKEAETDRPVPNAAGACPLLYRFILFSRWIRSSDSVRTVKPDAFIPHPYPDLSVTRHKNLSEQELWRIAQGIADARPATLYGRADIRADEARRQSLDVEPRPVADNPNHAAVIGWPVDKPAQKIIAQELAAKANFVPKLPGQA